MKKHSTKIIAIVLIILVIGVVGKFAYAKYTSTDAYKIEQVRKESQSLISEVSKIMVLPDEEPAIFVVQDPNQLIAQQLFFKGAEKGDKLMVFQKAGKAVLYSPSKNKIINVGPVTFDQVAAAPAASLQKDQSPTTSATLVTPDTTVKTTVKKK